MSELIQPHPTNAEQDSNIMLYNRRDTDKRWNEFPLARVVIDGGYDLYSEVEDDEEPAGRFGYKATLDDGSFMTASDFNSPEAARNACYIALQRNLWMAPAPKYKQATRAEVFGPIGQPEGKLAKFLEKWDEQHG